MERNVHGASVSEPTSESCARVVVASVRRKFGVVVPIPTDPKKDELAVVVASKLPTVSCVPVAMI